MVYQDTKVMIETGQLWSIGNDYYCKLNSP